jgi:hypothetical protein
MIEPDALRRVAQSKVRLAYAGDPLNIGKRTLSGADEEFIRMTDIRRQIKAKERSKGDGSIASGTGLTEGKYREPTLRRLVRSGRIGSDECNAIDEIEFVYMKLCGDLLLKGYEIKERTSASPPQGYSSKFLDAYFKRYKPWADFWSERKKRFGDPTLEVIFDVLMSGRTGKQLDSDHGWRHGFGIKVFIDGLRDYAVAAGWVGGDAGVKWREAARQNFPL